MSTLVLNDGHGPRNLYLGIRGLITDWAEVNIARI